jgi:hypothetical protein
MEDGSSVAARSDKRECSASEGHEDVKYGKQFPCWICAEPSSHCPALTATWLQGYVRSRPDACHQNFRCATASAVSRSTRGGQKRFEFAPIMRPRVEESFRYLPRGQRRVMEVWSDPSVGQPQDVALWETKSSKLLDSRHLVLLRCRPRVVRMMPFSQSSCE